MQIKIVMTIINASRQSNTKRTHFTQTKTAAIADDLFKQVRPFHITAIQRTKIIVHLENGTCRKLMLYYQDRDLFLRNHSAV